MGDMNDMGSAVQVQFDEADLAGKIAQLDDTQFDTLTFGVIGFDAATVVQRYNATESKYAGLPHARVIGQPLFTAVAPCMNNFMVAQRFEDAAAAGSSVDETIDYVLTLRMKPIKVKLRLLAVAGAPLRYVLVNRRP